MIPESRKTDEQILAERKRRAEERGTVQANGQAKRRKRKSARFELLNRMVDVFQEQLTPTEFSVWVTLWRYADKDNLIATSHNRVAGVCGLSRRTVIRTIASLTDKKFLAIKRRGKSKDNTPNEYQLRLPT